MTSGTDLLAVSERISWWHYAKRKRFFPGQHVRHSNRRFTILHLPALVIIISVPSSLNLSHNSFPSNSTVMFLSSSLEELSNILSLSSSSVVTSLDEDFILLAGGGWVVSSSEALSAVSFGEYFGSKISELKILFRKHLLNCGLLVIILN